MRALALALLLTAVPAAAIEPILEPGEELEARVDGDLNGDGVDDVAYLAGNEDGRSLTVLLTVKDESSVDLVPERLTLETTPLGAGELEIARGVLIFEDLTGGTTAIASTRRYRYDMASKHMRLIGLDATLYSRTYAHDGFELSWNLLTGDLLTRKLHLNELGGDTAYDPIAERRTKRRSDKVWLADTPDPDALISELSGV